MCIAGFHPVISYLELFPVIRVHAAGDSEPLEAGLAVWAARHLEWREQMSPCSAMISRPSPVEPDARPRVNCPLGRCALRSGDQCVVVCSTCQRLPLILERVELLRDCSPASDHLEVELTKVLVEQGDRNVLRAHVRWVPGPRNLPERQEPPSLLLLNPEDVDLHVAQLGNALALDNSNRCAGVHPDAGAHVHAAEVGEQREDPERFCRRSHNGV